MRMGCTLMVCARDECTIWCWTAEDVTHQIQVDKAYAFCRVRLLCVFRPSCTIFQRTSESTSPLVVSARKLLLCCHQKDCQFQSVFGDSCSANIMPHNLCVNLASAPCLFQHAPRGPPGIAALTSGPSSKPHHAELCGLFAAVFTWPRGDPWLPILCAVRCRCVCCSSCVSVLSCSVGVVGECVCVDVVVGDSHTVSSAVSLLLARAMWNTQSQRR